MLATAWLVGRAVHSAPTSAARREATSTTMAFSPLGCVGIPDHADDEHAVACREYFAAKHDECINVDQAISTAKCVISRLQGDAEEQAGMCTCMEYYEAIAVSALAAAARNNNDYDDYDDDYDYDDDGDDSYYGDDSYDAASFAACNKCYDACHSGAVDAADLPRCNEACEEEEACNVSLYDDDRQGYQEDGWELGFDVTVLHECHDECDARSCDQYNDEGSGEAESVGEGDAVHAGEGDTCSATHDERVGTTSEARCVSLAGCEYDAATDHCFSGLGNHQDEASGESEDEGMVVGGHNHDDLEHDECYVCHTACIKDIFGSGFGSGSLSGSGSTLPATHNDDEEHVQCHDGCEVQFPMTMADWVPVGESSDQCHGCHEECSEASDEGSEENQLCHFHCDADDCMVAGERPAGAPEMATGGEHVAGTHTAERPRRHATRSVKHLRRRALRNLKKGNGGAASAAAGGVRRSRRFADSMQCHVACDGGGDGSGVTVDGTVIDSLLQAVQSSATKGAAGGLINMLALAVAAAVALGAV